MKIVQLHNTLPSIASWLRSVAGESVSRADSHPVQTLHSCVSYSTSQTSVGSILKEWVVHQQADIPGRFWNSQPIFLPRQKHMDDAVWSYLQCAVFFCEAESVLAQRKRASTKHICTLTHGWPAQNTWTLSTHTTLQITPKHTHSKVAKAAGRYFTAA